MHLLVAFILLKHTSYLKRSNGGEHIKKHKMRKKKGGEMNGSMTRRRQGQQKDNTDRPE